MWKFVGKVPIPVTDLLTKIFTSNLNLHTYGFNDASDHASCICISVKVYSALNKMVIFDSAVLKKFKIQWKTGEPKRASACLHFQISTGASDKVKLAQRLLHASWCLHVQI